MNLLPKVMIFGCRKPPISVWEVRFSVVLDAHLWWIAGYQGWLENTFWNVVKFFMPSQFYLVNMDMWNTLDKNPKRTECKLQTYPMYSNDVPYWSILYRKPPRFWTNTLNFTAFGPWSRYFVASLGRFVKRRTWSIRWVVCPGSQSPPGSLHISSMGSL